MSNDTPLSLSAQLPVRAANAGLFVSRGKGIHGRRTIDSHELIFVERGTLSMEEDGRPFDVAAGQTLLLFPGRTHGGTRPFPPDLRFYWIHFSVDESRTAVREQPMPVPQHAALSDPDRLTALFRRFLDDQESDRLDDITGGLLVMLMLCEVTQAQNRSSADQGASAVLAQRAESHIRAHFDEPISTSSIAETLDCDPDYLGRVFGAAYGMTITRAIHRRRLKKARLLLLDGALTVDQISTNCGFEDAGYFRRIFRRYEGMSPVAYRRLYAQMHVNSE